MEVDGHTLLDATALLVLRDKLLNCVPTHNRGAHRVDRNEWMIIESSNQENRRKPSLVQSPSYSETKTLLTIVLSNRDY